MGLLIIISLLYFNNYLLYLHFKFYKEINNKKLPMSAIINFLFKYKNNWKNNLSELLDTNTFIKEVLNENRKEDKRRK